MASTATLSGQTTGVLERVFAALTDPARRERAVAGVLVMYAAAWGLYGAIAKSSQDVHFDMGEMVVWSREALAGTPKHPPLSAWLVRLWFSVFPQTDWAFYLLGSTLAAIALWAAWKISARYLDAEKRVAGLALLTLVPFFNFHALKFNANSVMTPLWALATWTFLASYETAVQTEPGAARSTWRVALLAALAGLAAAAAMLGKYWSVFLLAGLGIAALADVRRAAYFRSVAPWVTIAVGALALAPHLLWLHAHAGSTFAYALDSHAATWSQALRAMASYLAGTVAYAGAPLLVVVVAALPSAKALADTWWPRDAPRRFAAVAFLAPLLLPLAAALVTRERITPIWNIGAMTLLAVVLLSSPLVRLSHAAARRILGLAVAVPLIALLASPVVALAIHRAGLENHAADYRLVAQAVERAWRDTTDAPLRAFGSYNNLVLGASFYLPGHPKALDISAPPVTPWVTDTDIARDGIALVCPADDTGCMTLLAARSASPAARRTEVMLERRFLGFAGRPQRYVIVCVPPAQ